LVAVELVVTGLVAVAVAVVYYQVHLMLLQEHQLLLPWAQEEHLVQAVVYVVVEAEILQLHQELL
jgi:hypothetical protein